ncbi:MAG: CvpA family protein, partial [Burkholderiales bacterium]
MTWLDYAVVGVLGVCILWGLWRGLVREIVSVLGWVIAFLAANLFAGPLGQALPAGIPTPELRLAIAFVAIFVCSLAITTLLGLLLSKMVKAVGLEGLD